MLSEKKSMGKNKTNKQQNCIQNRKNRVKLKKQSSFLKEVNEAANPSAHKNVKFQGKGRDSKIIVRSKTQKFNQETVVRSASTGDQREHMHSLTPSLSKHLKANTEHEDQSSPDAGAVAVLTCHQ